MTSVTLFSDLVCHLGEGPAADPAMGKVFWLDIMEKRLIEKGFSGSGTIVHDLPLHASVCAPIDGDRQLIAGVGGLYVRDRATGKLSLLQAIDADRPEMRSNDGRVHPSGALWLGTMRWDKAAKGGAIYCYFKGELRQIFRDITIPNGIAFSADGKTAHFADSDAQTVYRVSTDPLTGLPTGEPTVFQSLSGVDGYPDGAIMDRDGIYWNARWASGILVGTAPDGTKVRRIAIPASQSSCPAFIGANADRMIVTSAYEGMDAAARAADPLAGQTFLVDMPVNGRFDPPVKIS